MINVGITSMFWLHVFGESFVYKWKPKKIQDLKNLIRITLMMIKAA